MKRTHKYYTLWGLGLKDHELGDLHTFAGKDFKLKNWPLKNMPTQKDIEDEDPLIAWIPWRVWKDLSPERREKYKRYTNMQRVLVLEEQDKPKELEHILETGFFEIVKCPLAKNTVQEIFTRAVEIRNLYSDLHHMTQEIYLERELLSRKNEHLSFLNRFLTRATETLDATQILENAFEDFSTVLPLQLLQGALFSPQADGSLEAEIFLADSLSQKVHTKWLDHIIEAATHLSGNKIKDYTLNFLADPLVSTHDVPLMCKPGKGKILLLPLRAANDTFGILSLFSDETFNLGRDQVEIVQSALKHMGLALKNALLFSEVKNQADYDGLTQLHNRKHFDQRLREELARHQRYSHPLSLLLLDLDLFKNINDTHGHQAGDYVLKEVGTLLKKTLRNTDYAARYGGEEFVLLLPHTHENQAWVLAERLRLLIAKHPFVFNNQKLNITTSIGISKMQTSALAPAPDLIHEADQALYKAKSNGRNTVVIAQPDTPQIATAQ